MPLRIIGDAPRTAEEWAEHVRETSRRRWDFHGGAFESPTTALDAPDYTDANGIKWGVAWKDRGDGWTEWRLRPLTQAAYYDIKAGAYPVTGLVASGSGPTWWENLAGAYKDMGESVDEYVAGEGRYESEAKGSKGGTLLLILLALYLIGSDERKYVNARGEQLF